MSYMTQQVIICVSYSGHSHVIAAADVVTAVVTAVVAVNATALVVCCYSSDRIQLNTLTLELTEGQDLRSPVYLAFVTHC